MKNLINEIIKKNERKNFEFNKKDIEMILISKEDLKNLISEDIKINQSKKDDKIYSYKNDNNEMIYLRLFQNHQKRNNHIKIKSDRISDDFRLKIISNNIKNRYEIFLSDNNNKRMKIYQNDNKDISLKEYDKLKNDLKSIQKIYQEKIS